MADRRRTGARKKDKIDDQKLSKEDTKIAKHVRFNCPTKKTMVSNEEVHYFTASNAVDLLLASKWGSKASKEAMFTDRKSAVAFLNTLLDKGLFWRARKLVPKRKDRPLENVKEQPKKEKEDGGSPKKNKKALKKEGQGDEKNKTIEEKKKGDEKNKTIEEKKKSDEKNKTIEEKKKSEEKNKTIEEKKKGDDPVEEKADDEDSDDKKKKKKVKLEFHSKQIFVDGNDVYVWVFDPTPFYKMFLGFLMVIGTVAACLFPLWPPWVRLGVYYLSMAGIAAFGVLLGVAFLRTVLFGIIWACTMGKHKLWILPNLTEDCGFFESFKPWYSYEYCDKKEKNKADKAANKKKDDDAEEETKGSDKENEEAINEEEVEEVEEEDGADEIRTDSDAISGSEDQAEPSIGSPTETELRKRTRKADSDDFVMVDDAEQT